VKREWKLVGGVYVPLKETNSQLFTRVGSQVPANCSESFIAKLLARNLMKSVNGSAGELSTLSHFFSLNYFPSKVLSDFLEIDLISILNGTSAHYQNGQLNSLWERGLFTFKI
jgi:hypothetical protein